MFQIEKRDWIAIEIALYKKSIIIIIIIVIIMHVKLREPHLNVLRRIFSFVTALHFCSVLELSLVGKLSQASKGVCFRIKWRFYWRLCSANLWRPSIKRPTSMNT